MKEYLMRALKRLGTMIRWLVRSRTPSAWVLRMLVGYLFGTMLHHIWGDVTIRVSPLAAHVRAAVAPVEPTPQIICPSADPKPLPDHLSIHLQDHTAVELNSDACLTLVFTARLRRIKLDAGEAVFQVAPDARRPF